MPTYEYVCSKCEHEFEKVQSIKDQALDICPKELCPRKPWGKGKVKRKINGGGGLLFKGSGFYITDYRSENYKSGAKKESESSKPAEPTKTEKTTGATSTTAPASASPAASPTPAKTKAE